MANLRFLNPPTMSKPTGYSHVAEVRKRMVGIGALLWPFAKAWHFVAMKLLLRQCKAGLPRRSPKGGGGRLGKPGKQE